MSHSICEEIPTIPQKEKGDTSHFLDKRIFRIEDENDRHPCL